MPTKTKITKTATVIDPQDAQLQKIEKRTLPLLQHARELVITSDAQYAQAGELRKDIKAHTNQIHELLDELIDDLYQAHKKGTSKRKNALAPLEQADRLLESARVLWSAQKERVRLEEQRRLLVEETERERESQVELATQLAAEGRLDEAAQVLGEEPEVRVEVMSSTPKTDGAFERTTWRAEVYDLAALAKAVALGDVPLLALEPAMPFLNSQAKAFKGLLQIPGVRAVSKTGETVRE